MKFSILVLTVGLLLPGFVRADSLQALRAFIRDIHTAKGVFSQQVIDSTGHIKQEASGTLTFSRPGKFRWVYSKPYEQLIVGDGSKLWLYDKDLDQVTMRKLGNALGSSPAALLAGSNEIDKYFDLKVLGRRDGLEWLEARPKDRESTFDSVKMGFAGNLLVSMELKDNFGQTTVLKFSKLERNPLLSPSDFKFTPPKGADVLSD
ncbi:MAG: outer membrane lipoprotein chaperone LolA [Thiobacillaceae bacterium]|jgi:outer membrane lipoprotein carrier protein